MGVVGHVLELIHELVGKANAAVLWGHSQRRHMPVPVCLSALHFSHDYGIFKTEKGQKRWRQREREKECVREEERVREKEKEKEKVCERGGKSV